MDAHPLDNPVYASLTGPHRDLALHRGRAVRYPPAIAAFAGFADVPDRDDWDDLAEISGPATVVILTGVLGPPPADWEILDDIPGVQLIDDGVAAADDDEAVELGVDDVPEMLALVAATRPGPFFRRTVELGSYLGFRHDGRLVAMAGQRLHAPGWAEISAVCTDPAFRGRGLSTRLVHSVAHRIRTRGETPFLHASAANVSAIRLYESLGFVLRRRPDFLGVRVPAGPDEPAPESRDAAH